jgi:hypothetical protein
MVEIETIRADRIARVSHHIQRKPASNLIHAIRVAQALKTPLNQFVTINFAHTRCPPALVSQQFEKLRDNYFCPWLRRSKRPRARVKPPAYVWVVENAGGCAAVHWLVHIPKGRVTDFKKRLVDWLAVIAGEVSCVSALHVRHARRPLGAGKYMLKGMDPVYAPFFRIRYEAQGVVHGKRSGFSRGLGPTARRKIQTAGLLPMAKRRFRVWPHPAP